MSLGCSAGLMAAGAIGDERGRRRTFVVGALMLAGATLLGALAPTSPVLVVALVAQGLRSAAVMAWGLGLVGRAAADRKSAPPTPHLPAAVDQAFPTGRPPSRATAAWGVALGAGVAVGPILAAGLAHLGGWRLPYVVIAAAALALGVAGQVLLRESRAAHPARSTSSVP